ADPDPARGPGVAVSHVRGALLVADQDVADPRLGQGVVHRHDGAAGVAEHHLDALAGEHLPDHLGSGHQAHRFASTVDRAARGRDAGSIGAAPVTAPSDAEDTSRAYLAITPPRYRGGGGDQL